MLPAPDVIFRADHAAQQTRAVHPAGAVVDGQHVILQRLDHFLAVKTAHLSTPRIAGKYRTPETPSPGARKTGSTSSACRYSRDTTGTAPAPNNCEAPSRLGPPSVLLDDVDLHSLDGAEALPHLLRQKTFLGQLLKLALDVVRAWEAAALYLVPHGAVTLGRVEEALD